MYKNGETALARILELVAKCPKELHEKCFEVLLAGYVQQEVGGIKAPAIAGQPAQIITMPPMPAITESAIPAAVLPRFKNTAKRLGIELAKLEELFDFTVDPFGLHAFTAPGKTSAEKCRNVVLLAAARTYLATGVWSADWQEVKALCVDQNCYQQNNFAVMVKQGSGDLFKTVETGKPVVLLSDGVKAAEKLLKAFSGVVEG